MNLTPQTQSDRNGLIELGKARRVRNTALPPWRLRKVKIFVESDVAAPLRLEDLAAAAGLSRMHFAAQFRVATGCRPHDYVLARRIEHAKTLIERAEMSLVQIALEVGFQSQAHFCTIFKRLTGRTPTNWRQQARAAGTLPPVVPLRDEMPRRRELISGKAKTNERGTMLFDRMPGRAEQSHSAKAA